MKMSKIFFRIAIFLAAALASGKLNAAISIYITPGPGQGSVFQVSGTFDAPMNVYLGNLAGFAVAPANAWTGGSSGVYAFNSSAATIVNNTSRGSADIADFSYAFYPNLFFANGTSIPVNTGDVLSLTSHGPVTSSAPFADFVPGNYVFSNPDLGPTTFYTYIIIPEPSSFALAGVGSVLFLLHRRRASSNTRAIQA